MKQTDEDISEFIVAWHADFGVTLSRDEADAEAARLLDFFVWMAEELGFQEADAQRRKLLGDNTP